MQMYRMCLPPTPLYPSGNLTDINRSIPVRKKALQTSQNTRINLEVSSYIRDNVPDTALFALGDMVSVLIVVS